MINLKPILLILLLLLAGVVFSQHRDGGHKMQRRQDYGKSLFKYQLYNFLSDQKNKSRVDFCFEMVNDVLTFVSDQNEFVAGYEINVVIYNSRKEIVTFKSVANKVTVQSFDQTNSRQNPHRHKLTFDLDPGKYQYDIELFDDESKLILKRQDKLTVRDFRPTAIHTSDIMFADQASKSEDGYKIVPNLDNVFNNINSAFSAYFEVYPAEKPDTIAVAIYILNSKNQKIFSKVQKHGNRPIIPVLVQFKDNVQQPGEYYLHVNTTDGARTEVVRRKFNVHWATIPLRETNIEIAIDQLSIIADKKAIKSIKDAPKEKKRKLFDEFWQQRDPSPGTPQNELRQEFFRRVDFANKNFSEVVSGRMGWKTDRGKVYIKFGPPDEIERNATELNMPAAEIWYYSKLDRKYIFSDRSGNGVYRLVKVD